PNVLSIAGVDPSGGAGILADLKAFSALGAYGTGVVAALTAQNTRRVDAVQMVAPSFVAAQIDTLLADVRIDAVKIGMLGSPQVVEAVAGRLAAHGVRRIVLDPVMVAKSGDRLLAAEAVDALRRLLVPMASVLTPNLPEAADLLGEDEAGDVAAMRSMARRLRALGPAIVVLKGGHLPGDTCTDIVEDGTRSIELASRRIATRNTHGTGCTLSAAIAALLPRHADPVDAIREARAYLAAAIGAADELRVGSGEGHGPVHHFHALWPASRSAG
ncbi:MAG: bifunctional hydroxymethylpyrimidine kinase/phosphomethylpyrimidine kinase, partial [Alphaproteobacteria bacterium]